jgi:hypothetical protein
LNNKIPGKAAILKRIQGALSLDLLHPKYAPEPERYVSACQGHCYVASEAMYYLFGRDAGFVPYVFNHGNGTHWWLVNEKSGEILDPTEPQLEGDRFPYHKGHRQAFLTASPSKRCQELMRRVKNWNGRWG